MSKEYALQKSLCDAEKISTWSLAAEFFHNIGSDKKCSADDAL